MINSNLSLFTIKTLLSDVTIESLLLSHQNGERTVNSQCTNYISVMVREKCKTIMLQFERSLYHAFMYLVDSIKRHNIRNI
jgi:hypothetical protein